MASIDKRILVHYLDTLLNIRTITDSSQNGLQVDNSRDIVTKLGYGVDATTYIFDRARDWGVDMLLVHHGIYWGTPLTMTGLHYGQISRLMRANMALYTVHLPLDGHPEYGNNAGIADTLVWFFGFAEHTRVPFDQNPDGSYIGCGIRFAAPQSSARLVEYMRSQGFEDTHYRFSGNTTFSSIAIVSGGGGFRLANAYTEGYDVYLTGELTHDRIAFAKEVGMDVLLGGHYETETIGVRRLAEHVAETFGVETVYVDEKY